MPPLICIAIEASSEAWTTTVTGSAGRASARTDPEHLQRQVSALGGADVRIHLEASALTRSAVGLLRPLVGQLVVCEPRQQPAHHRQPDQERPTGRR